tara:strand:- start:2780 stop:3733 length:954 start_codon:yes stop_codon:yes gene_type:complete
MSKLKGLLLTEGMHGMLSQVEGLAKGLNLEFIHEKIELRNFWKFFPPKITPVKNFVFKNKLKYDFNILISCGRKSVIPSIYLKRLYKKKIINIHIQNPKVSLSNFDYVVVPEHDKIDGKNVLTTKGAIHYLSKEDLILNRNYLASKISPNKKIVSFIIGGPNKYYDFSDDKIIYLFDKIKKNFISKNYQAIIIPSMRTPINIINKAKNFFDESQIVIPNVDKKAYLSALQLSDHIVVTCDSTSMISEAALTGKPIYVAQIATSKNDYRFREFNKLFKELGIIKNLDNTIEEWNYNKLDETKRISTYLKEKINKHDFS